MGGKRFWRNIHVFVYVFVTLTHRTATAAACLQPAGAECLTERAYCFLETFLSVA